MRFGRRVRGGHLLAIEITPMVDVVFLMIIFFMTTARFARETRADLDLPRERGEQQTTSEEAGLVINLQADGTILVGPEIVELDALAERVQVEVDRLRGRDPKQLKLMIRADRSADTGRLNQVVARLQRMGVGAARLATEVP